MDGGDLLRQPGAQDPTTLSHAQRMMTKPARPFVTIRSVQPGPTHSPGAHAPGSTMRTLIGQVDRTANPVPGTAELDQIVWTASGPDWVRGGTGLALRRIRMELATWDAIQRDAQEQVIGHTLDTGAPLPGTAEHDEPDFGPSARTARR